MTGFFHFYLLIHKLVIDELLIVSMPYDGLFSFLHCCSHPSTYISTGVNALWRAFFISTRIMSITLPVWAACVNALWRAFFISTRKIPDAFIVWRWVSMPYDGLFSFLPGGLSDKEKKVLEGVNALWRAFFISTQRAVVEKNARKVSMPYDGLFSFLLLERGHPVPLHGKGCQCPMTGFFHFYEAHYGFKHIIVDEVSMPYDGLFSFLPSGRRLTTVSSGGVNALWRAFFISTSWQSCST